MIFICSQKKQSTDLPSADESAFTQCASQYDACAHLVFIDFFRAKHLSPPFEPICHLSPLPPSFLSRPMCSNGTVPHCWSGDFPKSTGSLFTDYKISLFVSSSELTPLSRPSQGRPHALLRAINHSGRGITSCHAICFHRHLLVHVINIFLQISHPPPPLPFILQDKQTQVDRLCFGSCFLYKVTSIPALLL